MPSSKAQKSGLIILGIDPGYADMGWGVISVSGSAVRSLACGVVTSARSLPLAERLLHLDRELEKIIYRHKPGLAALEKLFFFKNQKTAMDVAQARGVLMLGCVRRGIPLVEYTPLEIKQSLTSYGHASKYQVGQMVKILLRLHALPPKDDAVDALAVALCAHYRTRSHR